MGRGRGVGKKKSNSKWLGRNGGSVVGTDKARREFRGAVCGKEDEGENEICLDVGRDNRESEIRYRARRRKRRQQRR